MKSPKVITKVSITGTIEALEIGESTTFTHKQAKAPQVRQAVVRLKNKTDRRFAATEKGIDGIKVTRIV